ncbi:PWI domain-containing protein [Ditylenchus destructor]|nr:PWI domain-containing protein [Ditylenchus destructor]
MDAGFYRGTNADQDNRFTDKEKKLLKTMKFEPVLDVKVDLSKVNIEVIKPWITAKLNDILGIEDDVVIEFVFTQLEDAKNVNPKIMQINLTGFLNARRSREFMAELWAMFVDAQGSPDGIPKAIVEKKIKELQITGANTVKLGEGEFTTKATVNDWRHRYQSLTGGRYGKTEPSFEVNQSDDRVSSPSRRRDERDVSRRRSRTRSPPRPPRRFTEKPTKRSDDENEESQPANNERIESSDEETHKKKKKHKRRHRGSSAEDGEDSGKEHFLFPFLVYIHPKFI